MIDMVLEEIKKDLDRRKGYYFCFLGAKVDLLVGINKNKIKDQ